MNKKGQGEVGVAVFVALVVIFIILFATFGYPVYRVWSQGKRGEADLREAEWNRQIAIKEAEAELESAELKKQSDIIRAEGVAEANKIIAQSLTEEYIRWKWVEGLHDGSSEIVYIPTEAGIPIMEAGRFNKE